MKHYIAEIKEVNGEYEFYTKFLFSCPVNKTDKEADSVLKGWRGNDDVEKDGDGYWITSDIYAEITKIKTLSKRDFDILSNHLAVL